MDIIFKDLIKLWGKPVNQEKIDFDLSIGFISTDTRTIEKGNFFVPLVGNRFDGHDYLDIAFDIGIQAAIVSEKFNGLVPKGLPHWVVPDTLYAYQQIALLHRKKLNLPVVAVTGSVGKTTTRELIREVLSSLGEIVSSRENENNDVGVTKTLLRGTKKDAAYVIEMGMRGLGQIERLSWVAEPDVAVITNVGQAHIGILGSRENIAKAKSEITSNLRSDGVVIIPFGDHLLEKALRKKWSGRIVRVAIEDFSLNWIGSKDDYLGVKDVEPDYISQIDMQNNFMFFEERKFKLPLEGRHNAMNFLMALTVATELGLSIKNLDHLKINMPMGRNRLVDCGQYLVLDETYNASPESVIASLELLVSKPGRHFAVLGTMLELGSESISLHQKVLKKAVELGLTGIVFVSCGEESNIIKKTIKELPNHDVVRTPRDAAVTLLSWLSPGDNILIKGSRKLELEKVLPYLQQ
ncbi:UDP-N-acetylmuramoyl-tripeptide--D-alanyl-D-alanine ligase [Prochlorococcus marinus]|uniref:UDP-N-acetylmuramoyl-tripeptide--D-alanyl-D- alanine ligase n=1 Tax=Prochlorococcus marinus TaxID=1219 RepID=UPI0022B5CCDD|nr:UDP-N-acetylmuramoyl-tripeptide--D-alanyl-D-alanine ligase [Prochlorococcus marinus]